MAVFHSLATQINQPESSNMSPGSLDTFSYVSPSTQQSSCIITSVSKPECSRQLFRKLEHDTSDAMLTRRLSNSVFDRLAGQKPQKSRIQDKNLTFCPKLNPISIRLAQERSDKMSKAGLQKKSRTKTTEECTFQPVILERSSQLVRNMDVGFLTRQQNHLEKKEKFVSACNTLLFSCIMILINADRKIIDFASSSKSPKEKETEATTAIIAKQHSSIPFSSKRRSSIIYQLRAQYEVREIEENQE